MGYVLKGKKFKSANGRFDTIWTKADYAELYSCYVTKKWSLRKVADHFGVSHSQIQGRVNEKGWMRRKQAGPEALTKLMPTVRRLYIKDKWTCEQIGDHLGFQEDAIRVRLKAEGKIRRNAGPIAIGKLVSQKAWNKWLAFDVTKASYEEYVRAARRFTNCVMYYWTEVVDPKSLRGEETHIDHQFSIHSSYYRWVEKSKKHVPRKPPLPLTLLCHPANLKAMGRIENATKGNSNHLTELQLVKNIKLFEKKHGVVFDG